MGYYTNTPPGDAEKPPGCLETLVIIRIVMGFSLIPIGAIMGVFLLFVLIFWAFTTHPALALLPMAAGGAGIWLLARWDQGRG